MNILCVSTGATIFQTASSGSMELSLTAQHVLTDARVDARFTTFLDLGVRSGADLLLDSVFRCRDVVLERLQVAGSTAMVHICGMAPRQQGAIDGGNPSAASDHRITTAS